MSDILERLRELPDKARFAGAMAQDVAEAIAEIERLRAMTEWHPLEQAPLGVEVVIGTFFLDSFTEHPRRVVVTEEFKSACAIPQHYYRLPIPAPKVTP